MNGMFGSGTSESLDIYWKHQVLPQETQLQCRKKNNYYNQVTNILRGRNPTSFTRETCKQGWRMNKIDNILPNDQRSTISWTTTPFWELMKVLRKRTGCENWTGRAACVHLVSKDILNASTPLTTRKLQLPKSHHICRHAVFVVFKMHIHKEIEKAFQAAKEHPEVRGPLASKE